MEEERINTEKIEKTEKKVKIDIDRYRAKEGEKISLKKFPTNCDMDVDKEYVKTVSMTAALEELSLYQAKLYAQNTYGLIIVLQAMDAAGKTARLSMYSLILIRTVSMSFLLSSRQRKKRITITCGVSIRHCPAGEISVFLIVPIMKMWWLPVSMI